MPSDVQPARRSDPGTSGPARLVVLVLLLALSLSAAPSRADWLAALVRLGKADGPSLHLPHPTPRRPGEAALRLDRDGSVHVTTARDSGLVAETLLSTDDLPGALQNVPGDILVGPADIDADPSLLKRIVAAAPDRVRLVAPDGSDVRLGVRDMGDGLLQLVAAPDDHLSLSLQAWKRQDILSARIMADLVDRSRVIALVPETDQVQRQLLRRHLGDRVGFVATEADLDAELSAATRRLVIILGHAEDGRFVLRGSRGEILIDRSVDKVQARIDSGHSVALLMGCRIACAATRSGPMADIDAIQTALALGSRRAFDTPLDFFRHLAAVTGGLHIEIDALGRMTGVATANLSASPRAVLATASLRLLVASHPKPPVTAYRLASSSLLTVLIIAAAAVLGWIAPLLGGLTPWKAWRMVVEGYVLATGRAEVDALPLGVSERVLLFLVGPITLVAGWLAGLVLLGCWLLLPLALLLGRVLLRAGLSDRAQLAVGAEPILAGWLPAWVNAAIPPLATALVLSLAAQTFALMVWPHPLPHLHGWGKPALFAAHFLVALGLLKALPPLRATFRVGCLILALPSTALFHLVRRLSRRPALVQPALVPEHA